MPYTPQTWSDLPSQTTPINAARLSHIETQYDQVAGDIDDPATPVGAAVAANADASVSAQVESGPLTGAALAASVNTTIETGLTGAAAQAIADTPELSSTIAGINTAPAVSFIPIGDSLTAYSGGGVSLATPAQWSGVANRDAKGMHAWMYFYLAQDVAVLGNAGIGGQEASQIAARFDTDVIAHSPAIVGILAGTNDEADDPTIASIQSMYEKASARGILVLAVTIPPGTSVGTTVEMHRLKVNAWIREWCRTHRGFILGDVASAWQDPALSGFKPLAAYVHDGVHPTALGAAVAGRVLANALRPFIPQSRTRAAVAVTPWNVLTNPHFTGSVGTVDANTKSIGGAWYVNGIAAGTTVTTAPRTDGYLGNYAEIVVPTGQSTVITSNVSVDGVKLSVGDTFTFSIGLEVVSIETGAVMRTVFAYAQQYNGSSFSNKAYDVYSDGGATPASPGWYGSGAPHPAGTYGFQTGQATVASGMSMVQFVVSITGGGTYRIYGAEVPNLTKIAAL